MNKDEKRIVGGWVKQARQIVKRSKVDPQLKEAADLIACMVNQSDENGWFKEDE